MANEVITFKQIDHDSFPMIIDRYQDGKGTPIYLKVGSPQRLFLKSEGSSTLQSMGSIVSGAEVNLAPPAEIVTVSRIDSDIYFQTSENQLFKAIATSPSEIKAEFVRKIGEEGETQERGGMCSQERDGNTYVYRICDDPSNGVLVDASESQLEGLRRKAVHRGKIIYERTAKQDGSTIEKLTENIIVVGSACPGYDFSFVDNSTSLIYNLMKGPLEVFNTDSMEVAELKTDLPNAFFRVLGVHEGAITVQAGNLVFSGQLPQKYCP